MALARRRIIRPTVNGSPDTAAQQRQFQRLRARLETARAGRDRWHKRLCRAFNAMTKHHKAVARLERQLTELEA